MASAAQATGYRACPPEQAPTWAGSETPSLKREETRHFRNAIDMGDVLAALNEKIAAIHGAWRRIGAAAANDPLT
jgi:hypothetical protein